MPPFVQRLSWLNPPPFADQGADGLTIRTAAGTDFWRRTHYGFEADNGHFLRVPVTGGFRIITTVRLKPVHQYDQAGLMIRVSPECWLKTSQEFEPDGPSRLGAVVTNGGYSDWSTQDADASVARVSLRLDYGGGDCTVFADVNGAGSWSQIRMAHLLEAGESVETGLYACSPKGAGFEACFEYLQITAI
jgi:regulation of enolase protein 1 (concanavalin A-like superfamily)